MDMQQAIMFLTIKHYNKFPMMIPTTLMIQEQFYSRNTLQVFKHSMNSDMLWDWITFLIPIIIVKPLLQDVTWKVLQDFLLDQLIANALIRIWLDRIKLGFKMVQQLNWTLHSHGLIGHNTLLWNKVCHSCGISAGNIMTQVKCLRQLSSLVKKNLGMS